MRNSRKLLIKKKEEFKKINVCGISHTDFIYGINLIENIKNRFQLIIKKNTIKYACLLKLFISIQSNILQS